MGRMTEDNFHHHHMADGTIVRHSHPEDSPHGLRIVQTNPEGFAMATTSTERYAAEMLSGAVAPAVFVPALRLVTCPRCTELYESFQRALEVDQLIGSETSGQHRRYRWRLYRAHASTCGAQK